MSSLESGVNYCIFTESWSRSLRSGELLDGSVRIDDKVASTSTWRWKSVSMMTLHQFLGWDKDNSLTRYTITPREQTWDGVYCSTL